MLTTITDKQLFDIITKAIESCERHIAKRAAEYAISRTIEHLTNIRVIDKNQNSLVQVRIVNAACYVPLYLSQDEAHGRD